MRYAKLTQLVCGDPWAIRSEKLQAMVQALQVVIGGRESEFVAARPAPEPRKRGAVAVLPMRGVLAQHAGMVTESSGGTSTQRYGEQISAAAADADVKAIVLDIDSPGGSVYGVQELADVVDGARRQKRVVAVANSEASSAAYWIGSQATEFVATPGGEVGSIGIIAVHTDASGAYEQGGVKPTVLRAGKYKGEGNSYEPLTEEARDYIQTRLDEYYGMFLRAVARGRSRSVSDVEERFGQGRVFGASEAVKRGMIDRIATLDEVIGELAQTRSPSLYRRRAAIAGF